MKLPILKKAQLLQYGNIKKLKPYHHICLSLIIPHGSTDIWTHEYKKVAINYGSSFLCLSLLSKPIQYILLFFYSVLHVRNDCPLSLPYPYIYSILLHTSWLWFPEWAFTYFAWIHTILHYIKVKPFLSPKKYLSLLSFSFGIYFLIKRQNIENHESLWIPIVIGHILTNES